MDLQKDVSLRFTSTGVLFAERSAVVTATHPHVAVRAPGAVVRQSPSAFVHLPGKQALCVHSSVKRAPGVGSLANLVISALLGYLLFVCCSTLKTDISVNELRLLYKRVFAAQQAISSPIKQSFFQHWSQLSDAATDNKLQTLLDKSTAVVAAFTRDSSIYTDESKNSQTSTPGSDSDSTWLSWGWRKPRRLVGFARAAGDSALVATIHDLIVHPDLQGYGLGSILLRRLLTQVSSEGVFDVGLVTPSHLQPFFHSCSFDLDREDSVPMAMSQQWCKGEQEINAPLQNSKGLLQLLDTAIDVQPLTARR